MWSLSRYRRLCVNSYALEFFRRGFLTGKSSYGGATCNGFNTKRIAGMNGWVKLKRGIDNGS